MLLAIGAIDYGVLALYLLVMVAIGFYFSRQQHTSKDFFLAGRSMGWFPVGLSIMATLLSALSYSGVPGEGYYVGFKFLIMPLSIWITAPLLLWWILPLYHRLELFSVYEYLEMRFDQTTRLASSLVFIVWRLLWLGGVLYAPVKVLIVAAGLDIPEWLLIVVLGLVSTAYTFLGGMKAVIWTDVIQTIVMAGGVVMIVGVIWWNLDGGAGRVWEVAESLGRTKVVDTNFDWSQRWTIWGILPHMALAMLSFYVADQITAQRYFTSQSVTVARRSFLLNCVSVTIMIPALMYVGVALLAYYHDNPQQMRPKWVANLHVSGTKDTTGKSITFPDTRKPLKDPETKKEIKDPRTGKTVLDPSSGKPLIDWKKDTLDEKTVHRLVNQKRLLRPNRKDTPFTDVEEDRLIDLKTGKIDVNKLGKRKPPPPFGKLKRGEIILHENAKDELMPHFITHKLTWGLGGLILAALFAASMSSMDSGLNSICTVLITDFHRKWGWGKNWLARWVGKNPHELNEADELKIARPLVLAIGIAATLFALVVGQLGDIFKIMLLVINTFGGPLMSIFLLGIFTRRTTARSALAALVLGTLFTAWLAIPGIIPSLKWITPFPDPDGIWPLTFGVVFTLAVGYLLGLIWGKQKSREELRGLTVGCGQLGIRQRDTSQLDVSNINSEPDDDSPDDFWK